MLKKTDAVVYDFGKVRFIGSTVAKVVDDRPDLERRIERLEDIANTLLRAYEIQQNKSSSEK